MRLYYRVSILFRNFALIMYNKKTIDNYDTDRTTENGLSIPRFLGDAGKEQEVSSVFATVLARGCHQGNESQGSVQNNWLDSVEQLAKEQGIWIDRLSSIAAAEIGHGHENTVFLSKNGNSVIKFNNLAYIYDKTSIIQFIERINSHNEFAHNAPYTLLGFAKNPKGRIGLVMSQPYIKMAMEADSYTIGGRLGWTNDICEFNDAVPRNVLMDVQGNLYFIDLQINNPKRLYQYLANFRQSKKKVARP